MFRVDRDVPVQSARPPRNLARNGLLRGFHGNRIFVVHRFFPWCFLRASLKPALPAHRSEPILCERRRERRCPLSQALQRRNLTKEGLPRLGQFNERSDGVLNRTCLPSDIIQTIIKVFLQTSPPSSRRQLLDYRSDSAQHRLRFW